MNADKLRAQCVLDAIPEHVIRALPVIVNSIDGGLQVLSVYRNNGLLTIDVDILNASPAWNGTGLPPVGTVCELRFGHWNDWEECTVLCIGELMVFIRQTKPDGKVFEGSMNRDGVMFRQIRTPEQISESKRFNAVEQMSRVFNEGGGQADYADGINALYAAGYLKFEIVEDQQ